jgi:hypothetical protein
MRHYIYLMLTKLFLRLRLNDFTALIQKRRSLKTDLYYNYIIIHFFNRLNGCQQPHFSILSSLYYNASGLSQSSETNAFPPPNLLPPHFPRQPLAKELQS